MRKQLIVILPITSSARHPHRLKKKYEPCHWDTVNNMFPDLAHHKKYVSCSGTPSKICFLFWHTIKNINPGTGTLQKYVLFSGTLQKISPLYWNTVKNMFPVLGHCKKILYLPHPLTPKKNFIPVLKKA